MFPYGYNAMIQSQGAYEQSLKNIIDQANNQLQQIQNQPPMPIQQQPTNLTQNFQLAPNNMQSNFKLVNNLKDVEKEIVLADTYFLTKDNSQMWIKNSKGDLRTFEIEEIIQKDEKDILIEKLQKQINELKGDTNNDKSNDSTNVNESTTTEQSTSVQPITTSKTAKRKSE